MLNQRGFNLGGGESVPRDVDYVIDAATDPIVTFMVTARSVTGELTSR